MVFFALFLNYGSGVYGLTLDQQFRLIGPFHPLSIGFSIKLSNPRIWNMSSDFYEILGVTKTATDEELKRAFRQLAKKVVFT